MRISDWSSDVCSSDLLRGDGDRPSAHADRPLYRLRPVLFAARSQYWRCRLGPGAGGHLGALGLRLPADLPVRQGRLTAERGMARALLNRIFRRRAAQTDSDDDPAVEAPTPDLSMRLTDRARAELQADFEARSEEHPRDRLTVLAKLRSEEHTSELQSLMRI